MIKNDTPFSRAKRLTLPLKRFRLAVYPKLFVSGVHGVVDEFEEMGVVKCCARMDLHTLRIILLYNGALMLDFSHLQERLCRHCRVCMEKNNSAMLYQMTLCSRLRSTTINSTVMTVDLHMMYDVVCSLVLRRHI